MAKAAKVAPTITGPARFGTLGAVDMNAFIATVVQREKPLKRVVTDGVALIAALKIAVAAANLLDVVKKGVIYGKDIDAETMFAKNSAIEEAIDAFDKALCRTVPDDYAGEILPVNARLLHGVIGKFGEAGELVQAILNQLEGGKLDVTNLAEELGDDAWYNGLILDEVRVLSGIELPEILFKNDAKLEARHGAKFNLEKSENRDVAAERAVLESSDDCADADSSVPALTV